MHTECESLGVPTMCPDICISRCDVCSKTEYGFYFDKECASTDHKSRIAFMYVDFEGLPWPLQVLIEC